MSESKPLLARQPIFNREMEVVAYELLYRSEEFAEEAVVVDGDHASTHVLLSAFTELSPDEVIGKHKAFVNYTRNLLAYPPPISPNQLVIEVLEG